MFNQSWLTNETYSTDKSIKLGILVPINTKLVIYKLFNSNYELFQSIPFATMSFLKRYDSALGVDDLTISESGDEIKLTLADDGAHGGIMRKITIFYKKQGTTYSLRKDLDMS